MKRLIIILFLFSLALPGLAQNSSWTIGVGFSPQWDGVSTSLYANRYLGDRWQVGLMPVYRWRKYQIDTFISKNVWVGLDINTRFFVVKDRIFSPYLYGFGGFISHRTKISDTSGTRNLEYNYLNFSYGGGTLFNVGSKGWSIDANIGYFWLYGHENGGRYNDLLYSFGAFKRF